MKKNFYITTPIYYVNGEPHIGATYTDVACDVMARFKRLDGYDVKFVTGTDEHGLKVKQAAEKKGIDAQSFTDIVSKNFMNLSEKMNISNDDFIRTTQTRHKKAAQALWNKLLENGEIYLDSYSGWYAVRDEAYYSEDELEKSEDGKMIAPSGAECEWVEEESYFFKLSKWQDKLLELYESHPEFIAPNSRRNEVISFVKGGLNDLSISRTTFDWGVAVPENDKHIMYVWIDALTNYLTAIGYPDTKCDEFKKYWPADLHMVGKDILRFHAVYWPAFLMAADIEPPKRIFAHGWWTSEGQKMSKSLGNVISPDVLIDKYGVDGSRYFMLREVPFGNDGDFSHQQAISRINGELSNGLGNLAQRTLSMIFKNLDGIYPEIDELTVEDKKLLNSAGEDLLNFVRKEIEQQRFHKALEQIWKIIGEANAYIDEQAPWNLKKTDTVRMGVVLYVISDTVRRLAIILSPFMPDSMNKMLNQLKVPENERSFEFIENMIKSGVKIEKPVGIFPRIEPDKEKAA